MIDFTLDRIRDLCAKLNDPQDDLNIIHIAGTNGKGSVAAFLSSVLKEAGLKVGTYTSPAVFSPEEVIRINGRPITKKKMEEGLAAVYALAGKQAKAPGSEAPGKERGGVSEFEALTALAFRHFRDENCDVVVLEAGMGGELDATNVAKNTKVCVFTPISSDHMEYLGNSLHNIAKNKAGILKKGCVAVSAPQEKEALAALKEKADLIGVPFFTLDPSMYSAHFDRKKKIQSFGIDLSLLKEWLGNSGFVPERMEDGKSNRKVVSDTVADESQERHESGAQEISPNGQPDVIPDCLSDLTVPLPGRHQIDNATLAVTAALAFRAQCPELFENGAGESTEGSAKISAERSTEGSAGPALRIRCTELFENGVKESTKQNATERAGRETAGGRTSKGRISGKEISRGLHNTKHPGRFEILSEAPVIILDGAHNIGGARVLHETLEQYYAEKRIIGIAGMLKDKDHEAVLKEVSPCLFRLFTVSTFGERGYDASSLAMDALSSNGGADSQFTDVTSNGAVDSQFTDVTSKRAAGSRFTDVTSIGGLEEAIELALVSAGKKDVILIFGSLSILKGAKQYLKKLGFDGKKK